MNTSAFVTTIRIKLEENQYKTYFFLFAFCLLTTSFTLEKIIGNLLAERLEIERKKDFVKGIESSFDERWKLHASQIKSYAYWPEVWELIKAKKNDKVYLNFQLDPSIDKQFDFFGIYLSPNEDFIIKWSEGSGNKRLPERKLIAHLFSLQSGKEGVSNNIIFFNEKHYLVTTTCLADNHGKPMIDGIMIFANELDNFMTTTSTLFPLQIEIMEGEEIPLNIYDSYSLAKLIIPGTKKITLVYKPNILRINLIRPYLIILLGIFSTISLALFAWILYKFKNPYGD
jgi:hypothetical protein